MPERQSYTPQGMMIDQPAVEFQGKIWSAVNNMVFRTGFPTQCDKGQDVFKDASFTEPPVYVQPSVAEAQNTWIYGADDTTTQSFWATDGATHVQIDPVPFIPWPQDVNALTGGNISGLPITNWQTQSGYWRRDFGTPGLITILPGAPICNAMRTHNNRILAMNTFGDSGAQPWPSTEETLVWSSLPKDPDTPPLDVPEADDWIPAIDNSAGFVQLSGGGPIVDGASLRSSFVVYGTNRTWIMDEVGGSFVFAIRKLSSTTGVMSRNCIAPTPRGHVVLSGDDVYVNDGTNFRSIIDNQNKKALFSILGDNFQNAFIVFYAARSEVWICIPSQGETFCTTAFVWDIGTQMWGRRDLPQIAAAGSGPLPFPTDTPKTWAEHDFAAFPDGWDELKQSWNRSVDQSPIEGLLLCAPDHSGQVGAHRFIALDGLIPGQPSANMYPVGGAFCQTTDLDLGDNDRSKFVKQVWPRIEGDTHVSGSANDQNLVLVTIRMTTDLLGSTSGAGNKVYGIGGVAAQVQKVGRYLSEVTFTESRIDGRPYVVSGFDVEYETAGRF